MHFVRLALCLVFLPATIRASVTSVPRPQKPGWPSESYASLVARYKDADLAVFEYRGGKKTFLAERAWLDAFKAALVTDSAQPAAYCFCVNVPLLKLYAKDKLLGTFELPHDDKVRFGVNDFTVPAETRETLVQLFRLALKDQGYSPPKLPPHAPPVQVDLKP